MTSPLFRNKPAPETLSHPILGKASETAKPLGPPMWDWATVRKVLVVRLRSIGDTVLATPSLYALRRFLPNAQIDIVLENWVAPLLDGFEYVDKVIGVERGSALSRARLARTLRLANYDVAYNLHGGTTATLLMRASGAKHRVGYASYQYTWLLTHAAPPASQSWGAEKTHSVEQQLALLGWTGVPVSDRPPTHLAVTPEAAESVAARLKTLGIGGSPIALLHPTAAFDTKQWAAENFARVAEYLVEGGIIPVAVVASRETAVLEELQGLSAAPVIGFSDLSLPEITALASKSRLFVGNDSGIAHIAAAVNTPSVVVFGSSNVHHWRPWSAGPNEVVREDLPCAP
ncbi:MAG: glycosyltransferase family 9 protein, partial [Candidatus Udaeobacter sp.]